jgi:hypothetical protein
MALEQAEQSSLWEQKGKIGKGKERKGKIEKEEDREGRERKGRITCGLRQVGIPAPFGPEKDGPFPQVGNLHKLGIHFCS